MTKIKNIVFDFGGVLVDWNPRYLYDKYFGDAELAVIEAPTSGAEVIDCGALW